MSRDNSGITVTLVDGTSVDDVASVAVRVSGRTNHIVIIRSAVAQLEARRQDIGTREPRG